MVNEFKSELILKLKNLGVFTTEMLMMIDDAVSSVVRNYEIKRVCTEIVEYTVKRCKELDDFLLRKEFRGCSGQTIRQYRYLLNSYVAWLDKDVKQATADDIRAFLTDYAKINNISDRTKDSKRLILRSFYTFLHENGIMKVNPSIAVEPIKYKQKARQPLTDLEVEMVRRVCKGNFEEALFETFFSTGCRVSEVVNMNISDINFDDGEIKVLGKGNKERIVLLTPKAQLAIQEYLLTRNDDSPALFVSEHGKHKRLGKCSLEKSIKEITGRAGLNRIVTCHHIRHSAITSWGDKGLPLDIIQTLAGHVKTDTTLLYLHTSPERIRRNYRSKIA